MGNIGDPPFEQAAVVPKVGLFVRQWMQWFRDIHREVVAASRLEYKLFGGNPPPVYSEEAEYAAFDYVLFPSGSPQSYYQARENIPGPAGPFDPDKWSNASLKDTRDHSVDSFVAAGYGSIGVLNPDSMNDINSTYQLIKGFDSKLVQTPRGVTYDNNGVRLSRVGVWEFSVKAAIEFTGVNNGRKLNLRSLIGLNPGNKFVFFAGRNQDGINLIVTFQFELKQSEVGELIQLQVGSDTDTFAGVTNVGTVWGIKHVSELKEAL